MYKKLIALADQLDAKNLHTEASIIDSILQEAYYRATDSAGGVPVVLQDGEYVKDKSKEEFEPLPWEAREEELKKQLEKQPLDKLKDLFEAIKKTVLGGKDSSSKFTFAAGQELMEHESQLELVTKLLEAPTPDIGKIVKIISTLPKGIAQYVIDLIKSIARKRVAPAAPVATSPTPNPASSPSKVSP